MSGYQFNCRICHDKITVDQHPNVPVCDECIEPMADRLCKEELNVGLNTRGVHKSYWMDEARFLMALAVKRWKPLNQRGLTTDMMGQPEVKRLGSSLDRT